MTWIVAGWRSKRTAHRSSATLLGMAGFISVVILLHFLLPYLPANLVTPSPGFARGALGGVVCVSGIAYAIWARLSLGRNWGLPMSRKVCPELITRGPYARVRHPIYTGIMLALLGSAVVTGIAVVIFALAIGAYFAVSAFREERHLLIEFPDAYSAYQARTKRFIPFLV